MTKQMQPKIRFKGFSGDWKENRLSDLGEINTGSTPLTSDERNYSKDGLLWVTPTDITNPLITNTNKKLSIQGQRTARIVPKNTILVTCIASIGKNAILTEQGSFNQQINSLTPYSNLAPYFLFSQSFFWSKKMSLLASKGTMQIVNKSQFSDIETSIPFIDEQTKIGGFFQQLDTAITLHQQKHTQTLNLKKAMLEKIFPKVGCKQPEIRFKGFSGDWEVISFEESLQETNRPIKMEDNKEYQLITVKRRNEGIISRSILKGKDIFVKSQFEVKTGDYIISKRQVVHGGNGLLPSCLDGSIVSNEYLVAQGTDKMDINFFSILSTLPMMYQKFFLSSYGVDIEKLFFDVADWKKRTVLVPKIKEQAKISNYFKQLDDTLALQAQQLKKLKNIKQACLEKMFV